MRITDSAIKKAADWLHRQPRWQIYLGHRVPRTLSAAKQDEAFAGFAKAVRMAVKESEKK
jgi:hypothetical protein